MSAASPAPIRSTLLPSPPTEMRRGLVLALIAHGLLVAALALGVSWNVREPEGNNAELWAAVPQIAQPAAAAPQPPTVVQVKPPLPVTPKIEPVLDAKISIEREKVRKERLKKEEERKEEDRLKQEQQQAQKARTEKLEELEQKKQALAQTQIEAQRAANLKKLLAEAGSATTGDKGKSDKTAGPSASYVGRIIGAIKPNVVFPSEIVGNPSAEVEIKVAPDGLILGRRLVKSSGIQEWDDAVLRAIEKTERLPRDTDGRVISHMTLVFKPKDLT